MSLFRDFTADRRGATAMLMSIALVPMVATFAVAVNYSSISSQRSSYQAIADAAALSGATASTTDTDEARKARAASWFATQVTAQNLAPATVSVTVKDGLVEVTATARIKSLVTMLDFGDLDVSVKASALLGKEVIRRVLDVAMCIDATGSMQNTINSVKARAQSFSDDLNAALIARGLEKFDYTRIRAIFYRDFSVDNDQWVYSYSSGWRKNPKAMVASDFYEMPAKKANLQSFIGSEAAGGGGDEPESSYECIHEGMTSKWFKVGDPIPNTLFKAEDIFPVIIVWSDANALPLGHFNSVNSGQYPASMPRNETDFRSKWNNSGVIDQKNRLLVHFGLCTRSSWAVGQSLIGYMCGGSLSDGNTNMINKIADAMASRYRNTLTRLTK